MFILFLEFQFRYLGQFHLFFIQIFQIESDGFCPAANGIRGTVCSNQMRQILGREQHHLPALMIPDQEIFLFSFPDMFYCISCHFAHRPFL